MSMKLGGGVLAALIWLAPASAMAEATLQLSGPYGNALGCKLVKGEGTASADALVLYPDRFESNGSKCEFVQVIPAKDNVQVVTALCEIPDDDARTIGLYSITPGKADPTALTIRDEYGADWDEVRPCG